MVVLAAMNDVQAVDAARECIYRYLTAAIAGPESSLWPSLFVSEATWAVREALVCLAELGSGSGFAEAEGGERLDALRHLVDVLGASPYEAADEYMRLFGLVVPSDCPPFETEYMPASESFARTQHMADAAGFYAAFGIRPSVDRRLRADALELQLEFMAFLLAKKRMAAEGASHEGAEQGVVCDEAARAFFKDHLVWWIPAFVHGLERASDGVFLKSLAGALGAFIDLERARFGIPRAQRHVRPESIEPRDEDSSCGTCPLNTTT